MIHKMNTLVVPEKFCVYYETPDTEASLAFLRTLWQLGLQGPVTVDLRTTKHLTGGASLMLFAHVNALQLRFGSRARVRILFPSRKHNPEGYHDVFTTGLSRALVSGSEKALALLAKDAVPFQSSNDPDSHAPLTVAYLTERLKLASDHQLVLMLSAAISEAMLNVKHHAYAHDRTDFTGVLESRWWQYAFFHRATGRFIFIIYDLGIGIIQSYRAVFDYPVDDAFVLEQALSYGYSRFQATEPWRGNGSEDLKHPIDPGEFLFVRCDGHRYTYKGVAQKATIDPTLGKLHGNLIEWVLTDSKG